MSNQWFRWYRDTSSDPKFKMVARQAEDFAEDVRGVTAPDVIACWVALLERVDDNGTVTVVTSLRNADDALTAYLNSVLGIPDSTAKAILDAMVDHGLLLKNGNYHVPKWQKRQYLDTTNAQRQARFRERKNNAKRNAPVTENNGRVTQPETETETETELKIERAKRAPCARSLPEDWFPEDGEKERLLQTYNGAELTAELLKFRDHFRANGKRMKDWNAAFRNWMRRSREFRRGSAAQSRTNEAFDKLDEVINGTGGLGLCEERSTAALLEFPKSSARPADIRGTTDKGPSGPAQVLIASFGGPSDGLPCDSEIPDDS